MLKKGPQNTENIAVFTFEKSVLLDPLNYIFSEGGDSTVISPFSECESGVLV